MRPHPHKAQVNLNINLNRRIRFILISTLPTVYLTWWGRWWWWVKIVNPVNQNKWTWTVLRILWVHHPNLVPPKTMGSILSADIQNQLLRSLYIRRPCLTLFLCLSLWYGLHVPRFSVSVLPTSLSLSLSFVLQKLPKPTHSFWVVKEMMMLQDLVM